MAEPEYMTLTDAGRVIAEAAARRRGEDPATAEPLDRETVRRMAGETLPGRKAGRYHTKGNPFPQATKVGSGRTAQLVFFPKDGETLADLARDFVRWSDKRPGYGAGARQRTGTRRVPAGQRLTNLARLSMKDVTVEVERKVRADGLVQMSSRWSVGRAYAGKTALMRFDGKRLYAVVDGQLVAAWKLPMNAEQLAKVAGGTGWGGTR